MRLVASGLDLTLPDDGFVWVARNDPESPSVDWLDRMAPALPEVAIEVVRVPATRCVKVFDAITTPRKPDARSSHVPTGWVVGPSLVVDGAAERVVCRDDVGGALLVGLFDVPDSGPAAGDFGPLTPPLEALAAAAR